MTRVVQHLRTKLYLTDSGEWIHQQGGAANFGSVAEAMLFCREYGITSDVQLVLGLGADIPGERPVDVPIPLFTAPRDGGSQ